MMFGTRYNYSYGLMGQNDIVLGSNAVMHFEDSLITMDFVIGQKSISFTMQNNSGKTARIIWDENLFIKYGSPGRVMHAGVKYTDRNNPQPPSIIPASTGAKSPASFKIFTAAIISGVAAAMDAPLVIGSPKLPNS